MQLIKYHGLGNDYLVLTEGPQISADEVVQICDRHTGVGGDGILEPTQSTRAPYGVQIWNPDGSIAEKSGNGLRIFAHWLVAHRGAPEQFRIDTGAAVVEARVQGFQVTIEMGRATTRPSDVPVVEHSVERPLLIGGDRLELTAIGIGNPHCVGFFDDLESLPWRRWGAALEVHDWFPNRTNVQFAKVLGPRELELRIWERGAGETQASGSSSCAVAAAAVLTGRCKPGRLTMTMPGGTLYVTVTEELDCRLEGPVEPICTVTVDPSWLSARS